VIFLDSKQTQIASYFFKNLSKESLDFANTKSFFFF